MRRPQLLAWLLLPAFAVLVACGKKEAPGTPGIGSPEDAVRESLLLIRDGKFDLFWKHALPPADFANLRADWPRRDAEAEPPTPEDRAKFEAGVKRLTDPDAEKKLFADLRPVLVKYDREYRDQMPLIGGIGQSMALTAIDQAKDLTSGQKRQLREALAIVAPRVQTVAWGDQVKAKAAIAVVVDTARKVNLSTPEALHTMDFDHAMTTWSTGWQGLKRLFDVYGLSLDKSFDSITLDTLENSGGSAHIKITYTLLDKPIETDATLVLLDGHWYDSDLLQQVRAQHVRLNPPPAAPTPPVPALPTPPVPALPAPPVPALPATAEPPPRATGAPVADARGR